MSKIKILLISLFLVSLIVINGCAWGFTGQVVREGSVSKADAINIATRVINEKYGRSQYIVYNAEIIENYWVSQAIGIGVKYVWIDINSGKATCINDNAAKPIECI